MIGLMVFGALAAYVAIFYQLTKHAPTRALKVTAIVVGVAIPLWDLPYGYVNYRVQCSRHGGLQILEKTPASESILIDGLGYRPQELARFGFKVIEYGPRTSSDVLTYTAKDNGLEKGRSPVRSKLRISSALDRTAGWNLSRRDVILSRISDGQIVARHSEFRWDGVWLQSQLPSSGGAAACHTNEDSQVWSVALRGSQ